MLTTLTKAGRQAAESVLTIAGVRVGTEEPDYTARPLADGVEVRSYGPRLAAQTTVPADQESARNEGFRRLARFIFGGNDTGDKIAMTAPVAQHENTADDWTISFYMPSDKTLDTLPAPVAAGQGGR